jgi:hypothetical protein
MKQPKFVPTEHKFSITSLANVSLSEGNSPNEDYAPSVAGARVFIVKVRINRFKSLQSIGRLEGLT